MMLATGFMALLSPAVGANLSGLRRLQATSYGLTFNTCDEANMITSEADCQSAAASIGANYASSAGSEWHSGCLFHGGNAYYSAHEDGSTQNPTDGYICSGGGLTFNTCDDAGMITSEADCQSAAASLGVNYADSAGSEWHSGCLFHGGNAYYSAHEDGSTQNPTDAYICQAPASSDTSGTSGCESDFDANGIVDVEDILIVLSAFGVSADGDANSDGVTAIEDLLYTLANYQEPCTNNGSVDSDDWNCHPETCHNDGHWIEVDFGEFETLEECHNLCACHPEATSMQFNDDGWCGCMTFEEGVVFADAIEGEHIGDGTECTICDVSTVVDADCGVEATCVYEVCHNDGHWVEVAWGEYYDIEECSNHCACHEEATAMQFNDPEDDEPGFCGCLTLEDISFEDATAEGAEHLGPEEWDHCTICSIEGVMGFSCHEYGGEECLDADWFADEYGMSCEAAVEAHQFGCDGDAWEGEPIGWFCEATCEWCEEEGECGDADWFEEEYGQDCETAVGGTGEWTDACEIEAWPEEPIWWFCPVACGECEAPSSGASCEDENDIAVALAYCQDVGAGGGFGAATPEAAVYGLCVAEVSDANAIYQVCLVQGVAETAAMLCAGLGYGTDTCGDVAAIAVASFGSGNGEDVCGIAANNAIAACGLVLDLVVEENCEDWAAADGPGLALSSEAIMNLAPSDAVTSIDWCASVNEDDCDNCGQTATEAACNSITDDALVGACEALGAPDAVYTLCIELGFGSDDCWDAVAMFNEDAEVQGALSMYGCAAFPFLQEPFCASAATLTAEGESCEDWGGFGYVPGSVDTDAFNLAVGTMAQNELAILASVCGNVEVSEACENHDMGHICATIDTEAACGIASDVAVSLAYCQSAPACGGDACAAATPEASVYGICMASTADSDAIETVCASEGVSTTAHIICSGLGYASDTCDDVAAIAVSTFGSGNSADVCAATAAGAQAVCPLVLDLVAEETCQDWAEVDGPNIALGTNAILGLQMHMPSGMTAIEYCESVNEEDCDNCGQIATNAACVSPTDEDLLASCDAIGASQTIYTICLDLGFDSDDCNDAVTIFDNTPEITAALDAYGCAALPSIQEGFCAAAAQLTDAGMSCVDWGGYGYINQSVDSDGLNAAIEALESDQLSLLSGACDAVAEMGDMGEDEVCANHPLGHICATIGDLNAAPPPAPVCEDNNALVSATAGMDCPTAVAVVTCGYDTGAGPLSTYCPLSCGVCEPPPPPPPPPCEDNNALVSATAGMDCPTAVAVVTCGYDTGAGPLSTYCPLSCGGC